MSLPCRAVAVACLLAAWRKEKIDESCLSVRTRVRCEAENETERASNFANT